MTCEDLLRELDRARRVVASLPRAKRVLIERTRVAEIALGARSAKYTAQEVSR